VARSPSGFVLLGAQVDRRVSLGPVERGWCDAMGVRHAVMYPWGRRLYGRGVERLWPHDLLELEDISGDWSR